jgi:hypothetical protein
MGSLRDRRYEMKNFMIISVIFSVLAAFAIAHAIHQTMPAETQVPFPGPVASAVHRFITVEDSYKKWTLWPGKGRQFKGREPLDYITTYVNENALYSFLVKEKMASGSFIVTENYTSDRELTALYVMYKIKGYNPQGGDWFWAQYDPKGKAVQSGQVKGCIDCHSSQEANDYVFTEKFVE